MTKLLTSANPSLKGLPPWERKQHLRRLQVATPNASQSSLFLDLPPELRNRIYELVLASQHRIDIDARPYITGRTTRSKTKARRSSAVVGEPLLLRTCQIVPNEATQMYYDLNVVKCRQRRLVYPWLEGVGATKRGMLADIRLFRRYSARHNDPYFNLNLLLDFQHFENELAEARTELKTGALRVYRKRARVTGKYNTHASNEG